MQQCGHVFVQRSQCGARARHPGPPAACIQQLQRGIACQQQGRQLHLFFGQRLPGIERMGPGPAPGAEAGMAQRNGLEVARHDVQPAPGGPQPQRQGANSASTIHSSRGPRSGKPSKRPRTAATKASRPSLTPKGSALSVMLRPSSSSPSAHTACTQPDAHQSSTSALASALRRATSAGASER